MVGDGGVGGFVGRLIVKIVPHCHTQSVMVQGRVVILFPIMKVMSRSQMFSSFVPTDVYSRLHIAKKNCPAQ